MKDIFADRAIEEFFAVAKNLNDGLCETFKAEELKEWTAMFDVEPGPLQKRFVTRWSEELFTPLVKGCAKYSKAVTSITSCSACVYHAVQYKDAQACDASFSIMGSLNLERKTATMGDVERSLVWEYLDELSRLALKSTRSKPPVVPTSEDIAQNIAKRKSERQADDPKATTLHSGVNDLWNDFCATRGAKIPDDVDRDVATILVTHNITTDTCKNRDEAVVRNAFPYLGDAPFTSEEWKALEQIVALVTMKGAIPSNMMRGIETMAHKLMNDMGSGAVDLSSLDVQNIGQEVLSNVSKEEVNAFAQNIDKLLPAISCMQNGFK